MEHQPVKLISGFKQAYIFHVQYFQQSDADTNGLQ